MLASAVIDTSIVTELVSLTKTVMGLFSEFPLNVLLVASLATVAFGIFRSARASVS
jgi:hypothetical protein